MKAVKGFLLWAAFLAASSLAIAQQRPQFIWQGEVEGIDVLYVHADHVEARAQEGAPPQGVRFHFYDPLPETQQDAQLEVIQGRGYVHILDQPRLENGYTLAISIEDRQPGSSFYSLALHWDTSGALFEHSRSSGRLDTLSWSGRVDEEAMVSCHERSCISMAIRGAPVTAERFKFSRPLPNRDLDVNLESAQGRGEIRLVEQPRQRNNYTARISIRDPQGGAGEYSFRLVWKRPNGKVAEPVLTQRGMVWSGVVDGRVRVTVQGGASFSEAIEGGPVTGETTDVLRPLPALSDLNPTIHMLQGRGRVAIVQSPSEKNNYTLVFEIDDPQPGSSAYAVEIDW
jgi:hypothetical protein